MIEETNKEPVPTEPTAEATEAKPEENLMETLEKEVEAEQTVKTEEAPATAEAEEAAKPKKKKEEEEVVEEKTYTIPLGKALIMPPRKRMFISSVSEAAGYRQLPACSRRAGTQ